MKSMFSITLLLALMETGFAQQDSLADVFPLAIGNKWTYGFYTRLAGTTVHLSSEDTGFVEYQVIGSIYSSDSIRWQFIQRRNFTETVYPVPPYPRAIQDSSNFEIVELTQGHHELYTPSYDPSECFPFQKSYTESSRFFRYTISDTTGHATISLNFTDPNNPGVPFNHHYTFLLKKEIGIIQTSGGHYDFITNLQTRHNLLTFELSVTDVNHSQVEQPDFFFLTQNYPNPFNPTTTISFSIGHSSFVTLKVFDVLGREVSSIVSEELKPGSYKRMFRGSGLPSGVYLYQLQSNNISQTKKLLLLK